jgi:fatty acid/phospholipid biosynthesis enzyme
MTNAPLLLENKKNNAKANNAIKKVNEAIVKANEAIVKANRANNKLNAKARLNLMAAKARERQAQLAVKKNNSVLKEMKSKTLRKVDAVNRPAMGPTVPNWTRAKLKPVVQGNRKVANNSNLMKHMKSFNMNRNKNRNWNAAYNKNAIVHVMTANSDVPIEIKRGERWKLQNERKKM